MPQTDRKIEQARQTTPERERPERKQSRDIPAEAALVLETILNGGSREQLSAEGMLALSHRMGNDALLSVLTLRSSGPDTESSPLPDGPCLTAPGEWSTGEPLLAEAPDFGGFTSVTAAAPMEL